MNEKGNECNELLMPIFQKIGKEANALYALGEEGEEYAKHKKSHSKQWKNQDAKLRELYAEATSIFKKYNPNFNKIYRT